MPRDYPIIDNIVEKLSTELGERGFSRVDPGEGEVVRYAKVDSPIKFQVGMKQDDQDGTWPNLNTIYLEFSYDLPEGVSQSPDNFTFPDNQMVDEFFRNLNIIYKGLNSYGFEDGRMKFFYHIGFEKNNTTVIEMRNVLREAVDYICNHVTNYVCMLTRTQFFDE